MCKLHHLACPHCLSALLITRRCNHINTRRADFTAAKLERKPDYFACPDFQLVAGSVRGYRVSKAETEVNESKSMCQYCEGPVWYVL